MRVVFTLLIFLATSCASAGTSANFDARLQSLAGKIGQWPTSISSDADQAKVLTQYQMIERDMDAEIAKHPADAELLAKRGWLHSMGHNMDAPMAWEMAEADYLKSIQMNPHSEDAAVGLAALYLNSDISNAPKAEAVLMRFKAVPGQQFSNRAKSTLAFAYLYQHKYAETAILAHELTAKDPKNADYKYLLTVSTTGVNKSATK